MHSYRKIKVSYTPIPNPLPVSGTVGLESETKESIRSINQIMEDVLVELRVLNWHIHELPRALNDGYNFGGDTEDETLRDDLRS